eukprot:6490719-Prymnesium_polylepis.1
MAVVTTEASEVGILRVRLARTAPTVGTDVRRHRGCCSHRRRHPPRTGTSAPRTRASTRIRRATLS